MATGALLPVGWGTTVGLTSGPVMPSNPSRTGLIFINASVSAAIAICPNVLNVGALGVYPGAVTPGIAVVNGAGSTTMQPGDKFIIDNLNCTCAWNGIGSGAGAVLTILES
jgi:hypothetical protein